MHLSFKPHNPIHLLLFLILFHHLPLHAAPDITNQFDYTVEIPEGWKPIPKQVLDWQFSNLKPMVKSYVIGYQEREGNLADIPYIVLVYMETPGIENTLFRQNVDSAVHEYKGAGFDGPAITDSIKYRFYLQKEKENDFLMLGECLGHNGVVSVSMVCAAKDSVRYKTLFLSVYNSIQMKKPFLSKNEAKAWLYEFFDKIFAVIILVGLFFGIRYLVRRNRKRNQDNTLKIN